MERTIVGIIYILSVTAMIVPYAMCLFIIAKTKKLVRVPFYRMAFYIGFCDIGQLILNGVFGGIMCVVPEPFPFWFQKITCAVINVLWYTYCFMAHAIAINRFVSVYWPLKVDEIFSYCNTTICIVLSFVHGFAFFPVFMWPTVYQHFSTETYSFEFDPIHYPGSTTALKIVMVDNWFHAIAMVIWYTLIYIGLKMKKPQIVNEAMAKNEAKAEKKVLLQAFILCSGDICADIGFLLRQLMPMSRWATMAANYIWLISSGNCSLIYLTLNSTIRNEFLKMFSKNKIGPVPPHQHAHSNACN